MKIILTLVAILVTVFSVYYFLGSDPKIPTPEKPTSLIPRVEMTCAGQKCLK